MDYENGIFIWIRNGATLSDKTVQKEFRLTQEELITENATS